MAVGESDRERWVRRLRAAATEATDCGATPDELAAALAEGVDDGQRRIAARDRQPTLDVPAPRRTDDAARPRLTPQPGSVISDFLEATRVI